MPFVHYKWIKKKEDKIVFISLYLLQIGIE